MKQLHTNLPHIEGYLQFITFRTFDSVDEFVKRLQNRSIGNSQKQQEIDNYLDSSKNGAYLTDDILRYLYDFLKSKDKNLYELISFCIMPNHVHLLIKPLMQTSKIIKNIKGTSSKHINAILHKSGKFWANDYFDKAIRDEEHFEIVYRYIENNPLKLKKFDNQERFYGKFSV